MSGTNAHSIVVDPSNQFLYVGNDGAGNVSGYSLNDTTGGLTIIIGSLFAAGNSPGFIATL
jgi:DNA-binding beta-propeller fold protein YncE